MYTPDHFRQERVEDMHALMREFPLATLITRSFRDTGPGETAAPDVQAHGAALNAEHVPMILSETPKPYGLLRCHVARANPVLADLDRGDPCLAIFHGPQAYMSPSWYATKQETGKVVPTWNYAVVHAYGPLRTVDDRAWLRNLLEDLTTEHEADLPRPWRIDDAPGPYIEGLLNHIVGIEMQVTRLSGKWKLGQNQPRRNQDGALAGLRARGTAEAKAVAQIMEQTLRGE